MAFLTSPEKHTFLLLHLRKLIMMSFFQFTMEISELIHHWTNCPNFNVWPLEKYEDLSSSDESCPVPQRQRPCRKKGLSIHEGPRALARITAIGLGGKTQQPGYGECSIFLMALWCAFKDSVLIRTRNSQAPEMWATGWGGATQNSKLMIIIEIHMLLTSSHVWVYLSIFLFIG